MSENSSRRAVSSRNTHWAQRTAVWLKDSGARPNQISIASVGFSAFAAFGLWGSTQPDLLQSVPRLLSLACVIAGILGRLLCNLFDGMVAVEGQLKTPAGEVFNDVPDRLSDLLIFVACGYAAAFASAAPLFWIQMGWAAACLAILSAYARHLGAGCGTRHFFVGPMAKQHRMAAALAATCASALLEPHWLTLGTSYRVTLVTVVLGTAYTCARRIALVTRALSE